MKEYPVFFPFGTHKYKMSLTGGNGGYGCFRITGHKGGNGGSVTLRFGNIDSDILVLSKDEIFVSESRNGCVFVSESKTQIRDIGTRNIIYVKGRAGKDGKEGRKSGADGQDIIIVLNEKYFSFESSNKTSLVVKGGACGLGYNRFLTNSSSQPSKGEHLMLDLLFVKKLEVDKFMSYREFYEYEDGASVKKRNFQGIESFIFEKSGMIVGVGDESIFTLK